ncbi:MAG: hypothetical protein JO172_07625 [Hyphomicrobiales bacterium]|nr:hypothetical protein [Hyphomicrobiales bacterium]
MRKILALFQVRSEKAKNFVVGTERVLDLIGALIHPLDPKIGAVGNRHDENVLPQQRETTGLACGLAWAGAIGAMCRISRRFVSALRDRNHRFTTIAKPEGESNLVGISIHFG